MMITNSKLSLAAFAAMSLIVLSACASQPPRVSNAALGYAVTNYAISADSNEEALSAALGSALSGVGIATAMPARAEVNIEVVRYSSPIIGFFYGGQHYASLAVELTDVSGAKISSFPLYVATNGDRSSADSDLAKAAAEIIAAKAANAFMPIKPSRKTLVKAAPEPVAEPVATTVLAAPVSDPIVPEIDNSEPCVIGPDGKCIAL